jgi:hypothetical protein
MLPLNEQLYWLRKSSLSRGHLANTTNGHGAALKGMIPFQIGSRSLQSVSQERFSERGVDSVFSDAEELDDDVICSRDLEKTDVKAAVFESHGLQDRYRALGHREDKVCEGPVVGLHRESVRLSHVR